MQKKILFYFLRQLPLLLIFSYVNGAPPLDFDRLSAEDRIVIETKRIILDGFPDAHNPSIITFDEKYLLIFRYVPNRNLNPWESHIGAVFLNHQFEPISEPQLLNTRSLNHKTVSQAEDARIFVYRNRFFLIYNDNLETPSPQTWERRDMYIAELFYKEGSFSLSAPLKLYYKDKYWSAMWQKNWVPFEWNKKLMLNYAINPQEVIFPNLINGECYHCYETFKELDWEYGILRGSSAAELVDGEYLAFFHSGCVMTSPASYGWELWHYFTGAYTFSSEPPFELKTITSLPIIADGFYTPSSYIKRIIFPGGFVVSGDLIYLAYGKDDSEMWIATLDKKELKKVLIPIKE